MLDIVKLYPLLTSVLGQSKRYSNHEHYFSCPFCSHYKPKLAINLGSGKWHCWKCSASGNRLISLFRRLHVDSSQIKELGTILKEEIPLLKNDTVAAELRLPNEFIPLWKPSSSVKYRHAIMYLRNRNITAFDIVKHHIGYCEMGRYADRIIIPSFASDGRLNYFVGRAYFDSMQSYLTPPINKNLIGFENLIRWDQPVVLVEGVFDAIAVKRNAIPLFGKIMCKKLHAALIQHKVPAVYVAIDSDATKDAVKIVRTLLSDGIDVKFVKLHGKDPSDIGFESCVSALRGAPSMTLSKLLELRLMDV